MSNKEIGCATSTQKMLETKHIKELLCFQETFCQIMNFAWKAFDCADLKSVFLLPNFHQ